MCGIMENREGDEMRRFWVGESFLCGFSVAESAPSGDG